MHDQWVEPSKLEADLIVNTMMSRLGPAVDVLTSHLRVKAGHVS